MDHLFNLFVLLYGLVAAASIVGIVFYGLCQRSQTNYSAISMVRSHYLLLLAPLFCLLLAPVLPSPKMSYGEFEPLQKNFVKPLFGEQGLFESKIFLKNSLSKYNDNQQVLYIPEVSLSKLLKVLLMLTLCGSLLVFLKQVIVARRFFGNGTRWRKIGRVEIKVYQSIDSPLALTLLGRSVVGIPLSLLSEPEKLWVVLKHEFLHLKFKDTSASVFLEFLKALLIYNPLLNLWVKKIMELQEMRVDECLAQKGKKTIKLYGNALLDVVSNQQRSPQKLVGATGMGMGTDKNQLSRRMVKMTKDYDQIKIKHTVMAMACVLFLSLGMTITAQAFSSKNPNTMKSVKELISERKLHPEFVIVTPEVVDALNMYTRTKKGRTFTKRALKNYSKHKKRLHDIIQIMDMPQILVAVAFVESGFQNVPEHKNPVKAAGMWQFIPSTARHYNMAVDQDYDDRMDISVETIAAMQYLKKLHRQFTDWHLAILAYNMGEKNLEKGIEKVGTRDPYLLVRNGVQGDANYLARVHAAMLIIEYPEIYAKDI